MRKPFGAGTGRHTVSASVVQARHETAHLSSRAVKRRRPMASQRSSLDLQVARPRSQNGNGRRETDHGRIPPVDQPGRMLAATPASGERRHRFPRVRLPSLRRQPAQGSVAPEKPPHRIRSPSPRRGPLRKVKSFQVRECAAWDEQAFHKHRRTIYQSDAMYETNRIAHADLQFCRYRGFCSNVPERNHPVFGPEAPLLHSLCERNELCSLALDLGGRHKGALALLTR